MYTKKLMGSHWPVNLPGSKRQHGLVVKAVSISILIADTVNSCQNELLNIDGKPARVFHCGLG